MASESYVNENQFSNVVFILFVQEDTHKNGLSEICVNLIPKRIGI